MLCSVCGKEKNKDEFYVSNKATCKECVKLRTKKNRLEKEDYYKEYDRNRPNHKERTESNRLRILDLKVSDPEKYDEQINNSRKEWIINNPLKRKAHSAVSNALRDGKLVKKAYCENCKENHPLEAHHESYEETHWLDVVWLCDVCHKKRHKILKEAKRKQEETPVLILPF